MSTRTLSQLAALAVALAITAPAVAQDQPAAERREAAAASGEQAVALAEIAFVPGSAEPRGSETAQLVRIAAWARANPHGIVVVNGHADASGPARATVQLSWQRARHVRDRLVALGISPYQIEVAAFGAERGRVPRVAVWGTYDDPAGDRW